jgi:hypothetical protein
MNMQIDVLWLSDRGSVGSEVKKRVVDLAEGELPAGMIFAKSDVGKKHGEIVEEMCNLKAVTFKTKETVDS